MFFASTDSASAMIPRAVSISASARIPSPWSEDGLPNSSVIIVSAFCAAAALTRVVALLSK